MVSIIPSGAKSDAGAPLPNVPVIIRYPDIFPGVSRNITSVLVVPLVIRSCFTEADSGFILLLLTLTLWSLLFSVSLLQKLCSASEVSLDIRNFTRACRNRAKVKGAKSPDLALAGVAQWIEGQPANQRIAGSIPNQGTCLGCRLGPQLGPHERQPHIHVSLSPLLPLCLKISK